MTDQPETNRQKALSTGDPADAQIFATLAIADAIRDYTPPASAQPTWTSQILTDLRILAASYSHSDMVGDVWDLINRYSPKD